MAEILVPIGFYLLTGVMVFSLPNLVRSSRTLYNRKRKTVRYFMYGFVFWFLYLSALSNKGFLNDFSFPPRMPIFVIIPALVVLLWFSGRPYVLKTIKSLPAHRFIYVQSFRIAVEILIWGGFLIGVFPKVVTFEGLNFDLWVGISAIPVGYLAQKKKVSNQLLIAWNVLSMLVLATTVYQFINYYFIADFQPDEISGKLTRLPYLFLASVLMPLAMFFHFVSIRQLKQD